MTLEQIDEEVEKIISTLTELIKQEEESETTSANLFLYKQHLKEAETLKHDVENDIEIRFDFGADLRQLQLESLKQSVA